MDNRKRFDGKSGIYSLNRPGYPAEIISALERENALRRDSSIADVGAGTGILSRLFLENGYRVFSVEPGQDMRNRAIRDLSTFSEARIVEGSAEDTTLPGASIDLVVAGQAFHWFDPGKAAMEFLRILKPGGMVALIWNDRVPEGGMNTDYERICRTYSHGYHASGSLVMDNGVLEGFFGGKYTLHRVANVQELDLEGLRGRYRSASYSLQPDDPDYGRAMDELERAYLSHERNGTVEIRYVTTMYLGKPIS